MGSPSARLATAIRKTLTTATLAGGLVAAAGASAAHDDSYYVWVDVLDVDPIVRVDHVDEPVERCYDARPEPRRSAGWRDDRYDRYDHYDDHDRYDRRRDHRARGDGGGAALLGGVVGGLIGNRLGDGRGRESEFTIAGALLGATIAGVAHDARRDQRRYDAPSRHRSSWRSEPVRRCEVTWESRPVERIDGYEVEYRYAGRRFTKIVDDHPGERMRVRVDVQPV